MTQDNYFSSILDDTFAESLLETVELEERLMTAQDNKKVIHQNQTDEGIRGGGEENRQIRNLCNSITINFYEVLLNRLQLDDMILVGLEGYDIELRPQLRTRRFTRSKTLQQEVDSVGCVEDIWKLIYFTDDPYDPLLHPISLLMYGIKTTDDFRVIYNDFYEEFMIVEKMLNKAKEKNDYKPVYDFIRTNYEKRPYMTEAMLEMIDRDMGIKGTVFDYSCK